MPKKKEPSIKETAAVTSIEMVGRDDSNQPVFKVTAEFHMVRMDHSMTLCQSIASGTMGERKVDFNSTCGMGAPAMGIWLDRKKGAKKRIRSSLNDTRIRVGFGMMPLLKAITDKLDDAVDGVEELAAPVKK